VHAVGILDAPEDEVTNAKGSFLNVVVVIALKLLLITSLSHDSSEPLLFEAVEVDAACLFGLFL
jgi:hypothetical protein